MNGVKESRQVTPAQAPGSVTRGKSHRKEKSAAELETMTRELKRANRVGSAQNESTLPRNEIVRDSPAVAFVIYPP